jgi:hypothetical protein
MWVPTVWMLLIFHMHFSSFSAPAGRYWSNYFQKLRRIFCKIFVLVIPDLSTEMQRSLLHFLNKSVLSVSSLITGTGVCFANIDCRVCLYVHIFSSCMPLPLFPYFTLLLAKFICLFIFFLFHLYFSLQSLYSFNSPPPPAPMVLAGIFQYP